MTKSSGKSKAVRQSGYRAIKKGGKADIAGWCRPGGTHGNGPDDSGPAGDGPVVLFGPDDLFVAEFGRKTLSVFDFDALGDDSETLIQTKLDATIVKAYAPGGATPLLLYAIDGYGKAWSIDFRPVPGCPTAKGLSAQPRIKRVAERAEGPINEIVVLRRKLMLHVTAPEKGKVLMEVDRRTGLAKTLGTLELDGDLSALDPARHNILMGRHKGELRFILTGEDSQRGGIDIHRLDVDRVTAAAVANGTHLVIARKGGLIRTLDMRAALPAVTARQADPLARICYLLRTLLKRCGCDCKCGPGTGEDDDRPRDPNDPGDDEPCGDRHSAKVGFTVHRFHRAGGHLVALSASATRMAVLDRRLNVQFERRLDRAGAEISEGQSHTQNLLIHLPRTAQVEAWRVADYVAQLKPRLPDDFGTLVPVPAPSVTYWGRRNPRAALNPTLQICIFPVIDGGQTYGDTDMTELVDQVSAKIFATVDDYYDETSFGEMAINFTVFGHDIGGARKPLVLPQPQASYWWDGFRAGGLQAVMPADWSDPVILDGTEAFEMQANPRAGAVKTYDLPFAAMWSSANLGNFPISLTFDGTETLELAVVTQTGDSHVLTLNFPATTLTVNQGGDMAGFLGDLGDLLTNAIRAAEATITGSPVLIQDVEFRRIRTSSADTAFGRAQGRFRITSAGGAATQKGQISVTGPAMPAAPLAALGLSMASTPGVMDSSGAVSAFFRECLRAAQADAGEGIGGTMAYFNTSVSTDFDAVAQEITVGVNLTADTGGQLATIERLSSSELAGTGWDTASPNPGSESGPNNSNALRHAVDLADDTFTAVLDHIRATTAWNRSTVESMFDNFDVMMIAHVGAPHAGIPPADQWACDEPADFGSKRMYARSHYATDQNPPGGEDPVQMGTARIIGQRFNAFNNPQMTNQAGVMAHEIGHAIGLPDLYSANGYRDDVDYVDPWAMMAGGNTNFHHFCGWSKWAMGWIADDPDPNVNRTIFVDLPSPTGTSVTEAWLVPVEYWDNAMRNDVRNEVGGSVPIGQLMKLNLGSDGGVTAFLELRAEGANFSQNLSPEPTVIATNGLDPNSDRHWAVNGLYRRSVHLLNDGTELRAINDTWDFATAPEFPVKGCVAEVADIRTVRGSIPVYRVRVEREQAEYIDLYFQDHVPSWKSPDIWIDWPGDNPDPTVPRVYPVGTPTDQGETVRFPSSGVEPHYVVARVHNAGNVRAEEVKVRWFVCDPPGAGDDGRWVNRGTQVISEVGPGTNEIAVFDWQVDNATNVHQCMRMEIIDWTVPSEVDPATGDTVALASDDVKLQNNNAQQNVFDFEALTSSPYLPINFLMQVHNDRVGTEIAALVPSDLPYGSKLTISPREQAIPSGQARVFNCTLELDDAVVRPGCNNDSGFLLTAWRRAEEADEIWGSCFYHIRPRYRTNLELLQGSWFQGRVVVHGKLHVLTDTAIDLAEDQPLAARIRMLTDGPEGGPNWRVVAIQSDGSFFLDTIIQGAKTMVIEAWFDRTDRLGSSVSNEITLKQGFVG
ncbi:immune inhibitor A domain-containing protein [Halomonas marinisediminis]|uniref:Peptidase M6-like domain-containing protein n=1 Tax=Halomonas marinisediminis TaxID=2546095 RepID=A0ABY2D7H2_9GAMM|nr:immune inhibitor A domain-containing protein [Halomonas marinisediminis]TDB02967.1 hypothetical protein E0702_08085 [Halomonas marinisediminis]